MVRLDNSHREDLLRLDGKHFAVRGEKADHFAIEVLPGLHVVDGIQPCNLHSCVPAVQSLAEPGKSDGLSCRADFKLGGTDDWFEVYVYEEDPASGRFRLVSSPSGTAGRGGCCPDCEAR